MKKINWNEMALTVWTAVGAMLVIMMILFAGGCFKQASEPVEQEPIVKYVEVQNLYHRDTMVWRLRGWHSTHGGCMVVR